MNNNNVPAPALAIVGDRVLSISGRWLGNVSAVSVGKFCLQPQDAEGVWLRADCVFHTQGGVLTLMYERGDLSRCLAEDDATVAPAKAVATQANAALPLSA